MTERDLSVFTNGAKILLLEKPQSGAHGKILIPRQRPSLYCVQPVLIRGSGVPLDGKGAGFLRTA